jgi:hypothetical protein
VVGVARLLLRLGIALGRVQAFESLEVEQIWIWYSLRLVFDLGSPDDPGTYIDVTRFEFVLPDGTPLEINVESDPRAVGAVLEVLHHRVTRATVGDWTLTLEFDNGARLRCPPHARREAWAAQLPDEPTAWHCPPGGGSDSPT